MNRRFRACLSLCAWWFCAGVVSAQLQVTSNITAVQAVQGILLGPGVTASNITFSGNPSQLGSFIGTSCFLGLDSGVVMSTGSVLGALGPNNAGGTTTYPNTTDGVGDIDLDQAAGGVGSTPNTNNAAILQFDFVPTGDSLSFRFVFASEEYLEFVGWINDVFGFFLSGPGISGPYSGNAANIALIPGSTSPVSINNVNDGSNSAYYVDNGTGTNAPYNADPRYIQYDGMTTVLTASALVECGHTYHIKLAIADYVDGVLDSGVFLEAGSFKSNAVTLSAQINSGGQDSTLYEGCGSATFFITRQGDLSITDTVPLIAGGTATEGADYNDLPDQLIFLPGMDTITVTVNALYDGVTEGPELIDLLGTWTGDCGTDTTMLHMYIDDPPPINLSLSNDTLLTCTDSTWVQAHVSGGYGNLTLDWNTGIPDGDTLAWLRPPQTTTYVLSVSDDCGIYAPVDSVTIAIFVPDTFLLQVHPDTLAHCPETPVMLYGNVSGGTPPFTYAWSEGLGSGDQITVAPATSHGYSITATDLCGNVHSGTTEITVDYDSMAVTVVPDTLICFGDTIPVRAVTSGGYGHLDLAWNTGNTSDTLFVHPHAWTDYVVTATDQCGIHVSDLGSVHVEHPMADFTIDGSTWENGFPITFRDLSFGAIIQWSWDFGSDGLVSGEVNPTITYPQPGTYPVRLAIMDTLGCVDTLVKTINVDPEFNLYLPTAFSPDGDGINEVFGVVGTNIIGFRMRIFDRWGRMVFETEDPAQGWDGTIAGHKPVPGVYNYVFRYLGPSGQMADRYGSVVLLK